MYCVNSIFVETGAEKPTEDRSEWTRLDSYKNIFTDKDLLSKRRIIEGEPGYGKSTLTLQLAYDWCNEVEDNPISRYDICIVLRLRQMGNVMSLYQAIKQYLLPDEPRLKTRDIKKVLASSKKVIFLLDGYDEYPHRNKDAHRDVGRIIRSEMFEEHDAILTTRYLPKDFDGSRTKHIKLTGFDEKARDQYIRRAVLKQDDNDACREINQAVESNPILDDLYQVPLFFVMFAHMCHDRKDFHKFKNVTDFFRYMVWCIEHHARNKMTTYDVEQFEVQYQADYGKLSKVAWNGLNRDHQQLLWEKSKIMQQLDKSYYNHYISIGILVEEEEVAPEQESKDEESFPIKTVVRFYHKIFCEFYASLTLAEIVVKTKDKRELKNLLTHLDPFDLQYVYRLACGVNFEASKTIITYLQSRLDGEKFAILCTLEQAEGIEETKETVRNLCSKRLQIRHDDSKLLKRSSVQLLEFASRYDVSVIFLEHDLSEYRFLAQ